VQLDEVVSLTPKAQKNVQVLKLMEEEKDKIIVPFLKKQALVGKLIRMPKKDDVQVPFDMQLIVEYYSR